MSTTGFGEKQQSTSVFKAQKIFLMSKRKFEHVEEGVDKESKKKRMNDDDDTPKESEDPHALYRLIGFYNCSLMEQLLVAGANPNIMVHRFFGSETPLKKAIRKLFWEYFVGRKLLADGGRKFWGNMEEGPGAGYKDSIERQIVLLLSYGADDSIAFTDRSTCRELLIWLISDKLTESDLYQQAEVERTKRKIRSIQDMEEVLNCVVKEDKPKPFFDNFLGDCSDNVLDWERVFGERICPFLFEYNRK